MSTDGSPGTNAHLAWRVRLFVGAAVLALVGMFADQDLPVFGAIALLAVAFGLRFLGSESSGTEDEEAVAADDEDHPGDPEPG